MVEETKKKDAKLRAVVRKAILLLDKEYGVPSPKPYKDPLEELARRQGKKVNALYVVMHRIRQRLLECVNRTMKAEGWT